MARKTTTFNKTGIARLPNDKPVVYEIKTPGGKVNYAGIAKRGRVQERLHEHLPGAKDSIPGARVTVQQVSTVAVARQKEMALIKHKEPKYNKTHKPE